MFRAPRRQLPRFLLSLLFALGLLVGGLTTPTQAASQSRAQMTSPRSALVGPGSGPATLLIHGVGNASDHILNGCNSDTTWGATEAFLSARGWPNVYSLGYYKGDYNCGPNPADQTDPQGNLYRFEQYWHLCPTYYDSGSSDGTTDEDDRHVACELAWYIYEYYTLYGTSVNIVAHSLGGVLIKYALYRSGLLGHDSHFPPYLSVHQVVTLSSPLNGVDAGGSVVCGGCWQIKELQPGIAGGIHDELTSADARGAQGAGGTNWTAEGQFDRHMGCDWTGPTAFEGIGYGLKIDYSNPVWQSDPHLPGDDACQYVAGVGQWYYGHGTYLLDNTSTAYNVPVKYCTGCGGDPSTSANFSHSLQELYLGLTGRCNILASTTTCDGTDPVATGCNSTKSLLAGDPSYLKVYWTTHCTTNWASVSAPSGYLVTVTIVRSPTKSWSNLSGKYVYCAPSRTTCPTGTWGTFGQYTTAWYTDMLYSPTDAFAVQITTSTGATYTSIWH